jgi:hypothetical protein
MYRPQREYNCSGTLRNVGGEQESGRELHNYQDEMMTEASISDFLTITGQV